jgi:glycosyltransferase involved in cell wall biosynthesis
VPASDDDGAQASLRIAMVAPPWFSVPPQAYGGIEDVIAHLVRGLVTRGHRVTLVGVGEDATPGEFLRTYARPQSERLGEPLPEVVHAAAAARMVANLELDLVHDHTLSGPLTAAGRPEPTLVTVHGAVDGEFGAYYRQLGTNVSLIAISESQRASAPDLNWVATVYNGIDVESFPYRETKESSVLFVGRCAPEKGAHLAIDAARAAGRHIIVTAKASEPAEEEYLEREIRPRLGDDVTYVGETDAEEKCQLYARAACLLFPIQWEEPFGLVMVEAMACGTPVVALRRGSVPEIIDHGRTGIICDSPDELPAAIEAAERLRPADCRAHVAERFSASTMVDGYEAVYRAVVRASSAADAVARPPVDA